MRQLEPKKINRYIKRIAAGDTGAVDILYEYTVRNMRCIAKYYLVNKSSVDDVLIHLYTSVIQSAKTFKDIKNGYNWMYTILRNLCKHENIREYKFDVIQAATYDIEDNSFQALKAITVSEAIDELNDKEKRLIYLMFWEGYTIKEIAETDGVPIASLYTLRARAFKKLKKFFN